MATETSNIDDMLMSGKNSTQPEAPEHQYKEHVEVEESQDFSYEDSNNLETEPLKNDSHSEYDSPEEVQEHEEAERDLDEYGNDKPKPRMYTEEEKNEAIRNAIQRRFKEDRQPQPSQQQIQQAQQNFEYDPNSEGNWQQQLKSYIKETFNEIQRDDVVRAQHYKEVQANQEFQDKFTNGMDRFSDFKEVVGSQPITDPMTYALRGIKDPAAFIYSASKRHSQELERISKIPDGYAQMVEMGKLEERMRKTSQATKAPRPVQRTREDTGMPEPKKKQDGDSIEDLIARADQKRRAQLTQRRGRG